MAFHDKLPIHDHIDGLRAREFDTLIVSRWNLARFDTQAALLKVIGQRITVGLFVQPCAALRLVYLSGGFLYNPRHFLLIHKKGLREIKYLSQRNGETEQQREIKKYLFVALFLCCSVLSLFFIV